MIKKVKRLLALTAASIVMTFSGAAIPAFGAVAFAADTGNAIANSVCTGSNQAGGESAQGVDCAAGSGESSSLDISGIARKIVNIFSIVVGAVAVIMIIYGGFRYITSGGDSNSVGNAKNTLIYAIVGLIIVALAQVIVHFVLSTATGSVSS